MGDNADVTARVEEQYIDKKRNTLNIQTLMEENQEQNLKSGSRTVSNMKEAEA